MKQCDRAKLQLKLQLEIAHFKFSRKESQHVRDTQQGRASRSTLPDR
jgi:hypothetical protein